MVLDCEVFSLIRHLVSDATLDIGGDLPDVIAEVGPGGHFLASNHTLANMRRQWMPRFFDRTTWEEWEVGTGRGAREAAADRAREILDNHTPVPLDKAMDQEIVRIIEAYER